MKDSGGIYSYTFIISWLVIEFETISGLHRVPYCPFLVKFKFLHYSTYCLCLCLTSLMTKIITKHLQGALIVVSAHSRGSGGSEMAIPASLGPRYQFQYDFIDNIMLSLYFLHINCVILCHLIPNGPDKVQEKVWKTSILPNLYKSRVLSLKSKNSILDSIEIN